MAQAMGLISPCDYSGYRAKNFAVLMFSDKPQQFIPYARIEVIREAIGTDKMVSQVFDGPIWIQAKRVIDYFRETIMSAYTIREPDRAGHRMVYNYPLAMFSELATNCILHKEYQIRILQRIKQMYIFHIPEAGIHFVMHIRIWMYRNYERMIFIFITEIRNCIDYSVNSFSVVFSSVSCYQNKLVIYLDILFFKESA